MLTRLRSILHPDAYHGHHETGPFFEGWYFKLVNAAEDERWCIIPGVYLGRNPADTHAFIQVMNGVTGESIYQPFDYSQFSSAVGQFEVHLGENRFTPQHIHLDLSNPTMTVKGDLMLNGVTPWPVTLASPGIMGWYAWIPGMECYHGVVSLYHTLQGTLEINQRGIDFSGGVGYTEKDWGQAFPKAWVWMQTNHFKHPGVCLTASAAIIPWRKHAFNGFIAGLWLDGVLYRFATYTGATLEEVTVTDQQAHMVVSNRSQRLELTAVRADGGILQAPTTHQMDRRIIETLSAQVQVRLLERSGSRWNERFTDTGQYAGLEVMGRLDS